MPEVRPVLVAGAGPSGLTAALELSRLGIPVRIVNKLPAPSAAPWALVLHAGTLALLEQRGLGRELAEAGHRVTATAVYRNAGRLGMARFAPAGGRRGCALVLSRAEALRILREQLARQGKVPGSWSTAALQLGRVLSARPRARGDLQPGDRIPDLRVMMCQAGAGGDATARETRLHEVIDPSRCTLLLTGPSSAGASSATLPDQVAPWQGLVCVRRIAPVRGDPEEAARFPLAFGRGQNFCSSGQTLTSAWPALKAACRGW